MEVRALRKNGVPGAYQDNAMPNCRFFTRARNAVCGANIRTGDVAEGWQSCRQHRKQEMWERGIANPTPEEERCTQWLTSGPRCNRKREGESLICAFHRGVNTRRDDRRRRVEEARRQAQERHEERMRDDPAYAERQRREQEDRRLAAILGPAESAYQRARYWSKLIRRRTERALENRAQWTAEQERAYVDWEGARDPAIQAWNEFRLRYRNQTEYDRHPPRRDVATDILIAQRWLDASIHCYNAFTREELFRDNIPAHAGGDGIGAFARDRQNVHTQEVVGMMRNAEALADEAQGDLLPEIFAAFEPFKEHARFDAVKQDVRQWWNASYVCQPQDYAYQKLVRKIWYKIRAHAEKQELEKRFWEEALDSLGMCATGHLGRLANVLQGYDETAAPPPAAFNPMECLQETMARIADMAEVADRLAAAREILEDLEIPEEDRAPWLEALA